MNGGDRNALIREAQIGNASALAEVGRLGDWLLTRRTGIGGSDVAALLGLSRYRRPIDVYLDKVGEGEQFAGNERTHWGKLLEPLVADEYQRRHGGESRCYLEGPFETARRADTPWHIYTIDRLVLAHERPASALRELPPPELITRVLEIKTHGFRSRDSYGDEGTDVVPFSHMCQALWYVAAIDCDGGADLAVLFDTHLFREFHVERDAAIEARLRDEVERFWLEHVVARVPPPADGSKQFSNYLRTRYERTTGRIVEPDEQTIELIEQLRAIECLARVVEDRKTRVRQAIATRMGDADGFTTSDRGRLLFKFDKRGRVNHSALAEHLAKQLGLSLRELKALQDAHRGKPPRRFYTPRIWLKDEPSALDANRVARLLGDGNGDGLHDERP